MANSGHSSSSKGSGSKSHSKSKSKSKSEKSGRSKEQAKTIIRNDPYAGSLSGSTGIERYMQEPAYVGAWNPYGAASGRK
ncbi:hypothetical protein N0V88_004347 [Collariella sp. IMI 366227]|nr:hypothetical protein N0V88_004347 [Collariella sp. IMI 366227]